MLGIRRYRGIQIDLWCGPHSEFACDHKIDLGEHAAGQLSQVIDLESAPQHVVYIWPQSVSPQNFFQALKSTLETLPQENLAKLRRITLVSSSLETYKTTQAELFATFTEF